VGGRKSTRAVDVGFRPQKIPAMAGTSMRARPTIAASSVVFLAERRDQPFADADQTGSAENTMEGDEHQAEPEQPVLGVDAEKFRGTE